MNIVDKAECLALKAHFNHVNNHDGEPYVLHLQRVYISTRDSGLSEVHQAVAWLHDSIEDTAVTFEDIMTDLGENEITAQIIVGVRGITKIPGVSNQEYYNRVSMNPVAKAVKIHDLHDNFGRNHLIEDETTRLRMAKKYSLGISMLTKS